MEFDNFKAREVFIDGQQKGEYHIASLTIDDTVLCNLLKVRFPKFHIDMIDSTGTLRLEYPIFMLIKNIMEQAAVYEHFIAFDKDLSEFRIVHDGQGRE
jgi:hypothetical protein